MRAAARCPPVTGAKLHPWPDCRTLGKGNIRLDLGPSRAVFSRVVEAFLILDSDSRLEAIHVRKEVNAP